jgi:hypothetical protein
MLNEYQGREILKELFEGRGYAIVEGFPFREGDVSFNADGWDPSARVGYEFMTTSERDHEDLSPDELLRLSEWIREGRLFLFIIDETDVGDADELRAAAESFLDEVERRRRA